MTTLYSGRNNICTTIYSGRSARNDHSTLKMKGMI